MQVLSKEVLSLIGIASVIFLLPPIFLIIYVLLHNRRKKEHEQEKADMQKAYENELLKTQMEVQEQTLKTVAHDLHDNVGQLLSLIAVTLSTIHIDKPEKVTEKVNHAADLTRRSIREVKALSRMLHAEELLSLGLAAAIEYELKWLQKSEIYEINFDKSDYVTPGVVNSRETIVFRLFQEIINNIIQHAKATTISISLRQTENSFTLSITDNGVGFNVDEILKHKMGMGLNNIIRRTALIGGTADISAMPGNGTIISITTPFE